VTREEKLEAAVRVGVEMRQKQISYFRTRTREALLQSLAAEKEFDARAAEALDLAVPDGQERLL
jgi:hypothetical protein